METAQTVSSHKIRMPDPIFWDLVARINWAVPSPEHKIMSKLLVLRLDSSAISGLRTTFDINKGRLARACTKWEEKNHKRLPCGDDSFGDLLAHVVGLGQAEYERNLQNPALLMERATAGDYRESFAYLIPYPLNLDEEQKVNERAVEAMDWLNGLVERNAPADMAARFMLLITGARQSQFTYREIEQKVRQAEKEFCAVMPELRKGDSLFAGWQLVNLINDLQEWGEAHRLVAKEVGSGG